MDNNTANQFAYYFLTYSIVESKVNNTHFITQRKNKKSCGTRTLQNQWFYYNLKPLNTQISPFLLITASLTPNLINKRL